MVKKRLKIVDALPLREEDIQNKGKYMNQEQLETRIVFESTTIDRELQ